MNALTSSVLALVLSTSMAMAADVAPLAAGHPAGVKNAQISPGFAVLGGLGVAAAVGIGIAVSGDSGNGATDTGKNAATVLTTSTAP
ncbi:MAG: hypothetical protein U1E93_11260 [Alphaproteobacteria bacterium]